MSGKIKEFFPKKDPYKIKGFRSFLYAESELFKTDFDDTSFYTSIRTGFLKFQKILV
jgi:hypothetical protein